jgi:pyridoxamine 5'-phosphate oxidase
LGALASAQSRVIVGRQELEKRYRHLEKKYAGKKIPCPKNWGGFRLTPQTIEFWINRENRLHDRLRYRRQKGRWKKEWLAP